MNIPIQYMQADGEFMIPGTRQTVNGELVRFAVGRLSMRDRQAAVAHMTGGPVPGEETACLIRRAIVQVAEERRERTFPPGGKIRSMRR
jgi:hypothetical protein